MTFMASSPRILTALMNSSASFLLRTKLRGTVTLPSTDCFAATLLQRHLKNEGLTGFVVFLRGKDARGKNILYVTKTKE